MFQAFPYEIAHGIVHTLAKHGGNLRDAKDALDTLQADPGAKNSNRKSGCLATPEWVEDQ